VILQDCSTTGLEPRRYPLSFECKAYVFRIQLFGVVMTESLEWDWPPTKRYRKRRRPRVEVLPPKQDEQEPRPQRVEIILRSQQRSTTNWPYTDCRCRRRPIPLPIQLRAVTHQRHSLEASARNADDSCGRRCSGVA
jgi:hypothetical protein